MVTRVQICGITNDDDATLAALIAHLETPGDPDWLAGDMIGALTSLTGQRFGGCQSSGE